MRNKCKTEYRRGRVFRSFACLLAVLLCLMSAFPVLAQGEIDLQRPVSLTLHYKKDGRAIEGAAFRLYRAAGVSQNLRYTPEGAFAAYGVVWSPQSSDEWKTLAETVSAYVKRDGVAAFKEGKTDRNGDLVFSGDDMKPGLYLVIGDRRVIGRYTYTPEPFFISFPSYGADNNWIYDQEAVPKSTSSYDPPGGGGDNPGGGTVTRKALKVWKDTGAESLRPQEVSVQLLRNGTVYASAKLNEANNWSYEWNGLDRSDTWELVEETVPAGYTVSVTREGVTFVVTNTRGTPNTPGGGGDNPPGEPGVPMTPGTPSTPMSGRPPEAPSPASDKPKRPTKLPQTGVLWWPVPLLAGGGLLLFGIGWYRARRRDE